MSPGLAPITRIGPVAGLTNGSLRSSAVSFLSSDVITPALQLISDFDLEHLAGPDLGDEGISWPTGRI